MNLLGLLEKMRIFSSVLRSMCADKYLPIKPDPPVISNISVTFFIKVGYYWVSHIFEYHIGAVIDEGVNK